MEAEAYSRNLSVLKVHEALENIRTLCFLCSPSPLFFGWVGKGFFERHCWCSLFLTLKVRAGFIIAIIPWKDKLGDKAERVRRCAQPLTSPQDT